MIEDGLFWHGALTLCYKEMVLYKNNYRVVFKIIIHIAWNWIYSMNKSKMKKLADLLHN